MKRIRSRLNRVSVTCVLTAFALVILCISHNPVHAKKKSDYDPSGRPEYDALLKVFIKQETTPAVRSYLMDSTRETQSQLKGLVSSCTTKGTKTDKVWAHLKFILRLDDEGMVKEARADSATSLGACIETALVGIQFKSPPLAPFYRMVTLDAESLSGV